MADKDAVTGTTGKGRFVYTIAFILIALITACSRNEGCNLRFIAEKAVLKEVPELESTHVINDFILTELMANIGVLPHGDALVAERNGQLRLVKNIHNSPQLLPCPVAVVDQGNLTGIAIHPDFKNNHFFYLCVERLENSLYVHSIELWQLSEDYTQAYLHSIVMKEPIEDQLPAQQQKSMWIVSHRQPSSHY